MSDHVTRARLREVSRALLHLHKAMLDDERAVYEQKHGAVSNTQLLTLLLEDEHFGWLRHLSSAIAAIDDAVASRDAVPDEKATALLARARDLVAPGDRTSPYAQKYDAAVQRAPQVAWAHVDAVQAITRHAGIET